jgi:hypothetical protein
MLEVRHLGGALAREAAHHGALATLRGSYLVFAGGLVVDADSRAANETALASIEQALAPYAVGKYLNFAEKVTDTSELFPPDTLRRLAAVKAAYDPDNVIQANHQIAPA